MMNINSEKNLASKKKIPLLLVIITVSALIIGLFYFLVLPKIKSRNVKGAKDTSEYVGVFLTNTQVYFGKIKKEDPSYIILTDVFFVAKKPKVAGEQATESAYSINPLINDPIGPADEIKLNRVNISTIQPLRNNSVVVQRIKLYKEQTARDTE